MYILGYFWPIKNVPWANGSGSGSGSEPAGSRIQFFGSVAALDGTYYWLRMEFGFLYTCVNAMDTIIHDIRRTSVCLTYPGRCKTPVKTAPRAAPMWSISMTYCWVFSESLLSNKCVYVLSFVALQAWPQTSRRVQTHTCDIVFTNIRLTAWTNFCFVFVFFAQCFWYFKIFKLRSGGTV